jgi:hypothetical protein
MRRAAVIVLTILAACSNSGSAKNPSLGSPAPASGSATKEAPEDALRRQLTEVAQGQYDNAYAELHPAQQAAFTKEIYKECKAKGPSIVIKGFEVVTSAPGKASVPGTDHGIAQRRAGLDAGDNAERVPCRRIVEVRRG